MVLASHQYIVSMLISFTGKAVVTAGPHDSTHKAGNGQILMSYAPGYTAVEGVNDVKMSGGVNDVRMPGSSVGKRAGGVDAGVEQTVGPEQRFRRMPSVFATCVLDEVGVTKAERDAVKYWLNLDVLARKKGLFVEEVRTSGKSGSSLDYIKIPTRLRKAQNSKEDGRECVDHYHYMPGGDQDPRVKRFRDFLRKRQRVSCTDPPSTTERDTCNLVDFEQVQESHNSPGSRTTLLLGIWASYLHNGTLLCFRLTLHASISSCLSFYP
jgi:hypothetical protein